MVINKNFSKYKYTITIKKLKTTKQGILCFNLLPHILLPHVTPFSI